MATQIEKLEKLMQPIESKWCIAVPGANSIIDTVNIKTQTTHIYGKTLADVRTERPEYANAVLMLFDDFLAQKVAKQHAPIVWTETTSEVFYEMLGCLPPALMLGSGFLVGEPYDHDASNGLPRYDAFKEQDGKYLSSSRPMTKREFKELMHL